MDLYVALVMPTVAVPTNQATPHRLAPWDLYCLDPGREIRSSFRIPLASLSGLDDLVTAGGKKKV